MQGARRHTGGRVGATDAQTARDLEVPANTFHSWIGKDYRVERQEKQVNDEHPYEAVKRLRQENGPYFALSSGEHGCVNGTSCSWRALLVSWDDSGSYEIEKCP